MYHIYTTDAFVLRSLYQGDADAFVWLYTRDLGRIGASVRSVRSVNSKHRHILQPYSRARVSLVRGKGGWRITGSEDAEHLWKTERKQRIPVIRVLQLVERLVHGEEANPDLYELLDKGVNCLTENLPKAAQEMAEVVLVGQILTCLGYQPVLEDGLLGKEMDADSLVALSKERNRIVRSINRALKASHL